MTALDIKKYLRENEITYEQLALKAGVSLYTLHNMLNGSTKTPLIGTVKSVMEALGFSVEDFEYAKNYPTRHFDLELWKKTKKEKKLRFEDLARISGLPLSTVNDVFSGRTRSPRVDTIQALEKALGLYKETEEASFPQTVVSPSAALSLTEKEKRLLKAFNALIPPMQDYILESTEKLVAKSQNAADSKRA